MHDFRDNSYRQSVTLLLLLIILWKNISIHTIWGPPEYYNQKQNKVLSFNMEKIDFQTTNAPNLIFKHDTYMAY